MAYNSILTQVETLVSTATSLTFGYGAGQTVPPRVLIMNNATAATITLPLSAATIPPSTSPDSGYLPPSDGVFLTIMNVGTSTVTIAAATGDTLVGSQTLTNTNGALTLVACAATNKWYAIGAAGGVGGTTTMSANGAFTASFTLGTVPTNGGSYKATAVSEVHGTASTSGTLQIEKATGTQAVGSGTNILTGTMSLSGTANTTIAGTLVATAGVTTFAPGNRVNAILAGTLTNLANCTITVEFLRL